MALLMTAQGSARAGVAGAAMVGRGCVEFVEVVFVAATFRSGSTISSIPASSLGTPYIMYGWMRAEARPIEAPSNMTEVYIFMLRNFQLLKLSKMIFWGDLLYLQRIVSI